MDISTEELKNILEDKLPDYAGREMVHLAKFKEIPQYASTSWISSVCQSSKDFIDTWNKSSKDRDKYCSDKMDDMLDKAYKKALKHEKDLGNDVSKLPKERPEEYTFEFLTNQDGLEKYMNNSVLDKNKTIETRIEMNVKKVKLKYDKEGDKIKKY